MHTSNHVTAGPVTRRVFLCWCVMYQPCSMFRRTSLERADQLLAWNRDDQAFFAAGACHILAFAFLEAYPAAGLVPVGLWPQGAESPSHTYVTDGAWAFDHAGWTREAELLEITRADEPVAKYQSRRIAVDLNTFCSRYNHRPRHLFAFDPWSRALRYVSRFALPGELRSLSARRWNENA